MFEVQSRRPLRRILFLLVVAAVPALLPAAKPEPAASFPLQDLAERVSPAVVKILVTGLASAEGDETGMLCRQRSIGSGVILDARGYILTNAHVVEGAQLIEVERSAPVVGPGSMPVASRQVHPARLVGVDQETDLALLKINGRGLPTLPLGDQRPVRPGEPVLAVGSPEGLFNSVTRGIISAVGRQAKGGSPMEFLQTDAPVHFGSSGGPLVDMEGYVVGLNTFIYSEGGGSEGLGFAIPAPTLKFVYQRLKKYGRVVRAEIQARAQCVTPGLAAGLGLAQDWGVVISDVTPGGPAELGGLRAKDVVLSVDGIPIRNLPCYATALSNHPVETPLTMEVLRGTGKVALSLSPLPRVEAFASLTTLARPENRVGKLGIYAADYAQDLASALPPLRTPAGVVVLGLSLDSNAAITELRVGDVIHALDDAPVERLSQLRAGLRRFRSGEKGVLTVEREGEMQYLVFEAP